MNAISARLTARLVDAVYALGRVPAVAGYAIRKRGRLAILMYHRVVDADSFRREPPENALSCVTEEQFARQISWLARHVRVMSMDEIPAHLAASGQYSAVVTFDDGYRDNLTRALPILEASGVPAIIYVATGYPEGDTVMWWHDLAAACRHRKEIRLQWRGCARDYRLDNARSRGRCFTDLRRLLMAEAPEAQKALLSQICRSSLNQRPETLCWEEICNLDRHPLITIGAHSHSHRNLGACDPAAAKADIRRGLDILECRLGHPVRHFAYPYGTSEAIPAGAESMLAGFGFTTAVTAMGGANRRGVSPYLLHRMAVRDTDTPERMVVKLSGWNALHGRQI